MVQIPPRSEVIARHKARGGRVAAVFPIHYPRALFRAHGVLPVEVWGPPGIDTTAGDAHLQATTCSIVRSGLSFLLGGGLSAVDVVVVPHACDSLQGLGSILLDFERPAQPVLTIYPPRAAEGSEGAIDFLAAELRAVGARLAGISGETVDDGVLLARVVDDEAADEALAGLWRQRRRIDLGDRDFYRLVRSREYLPAEQFTALAQGALAAATPWQRAGAGVLLSGLVPEPMALLDVVSDAGGIVVADDNACCGRRLYPAGRATDPWRRMAERLLGGPPDSTLGSAIGARADHLLAACRASEARAVIFAIVKSCEPELFYLPRIRARLEEAGIRVVVLELDVSEPLSYQAVTRLEALLEMVV